MGCKCKLCTRNKNVKKYLEKIKNTKAKRFFENLYDEMSEQEEDNDFIKLQYKLLKDELKSNHKELVNKLQEKPEFRLGI